MKYSLFTIAFSLLFTLSTNIYSQNTEQLDKKNGFQNFKFNTKISSYTKYTPKEIKPGRYSLQNTDDVVIGDYSIENLQLFFKDDILVRIKISLDDVDRTKNEVIYKGLVKNYGKQTSKNTSSLVGTYAQNIIWKGKYTSLTYQLSSYREGNTFQTKIHLIYQLDSEQKDVSDYL